MTDEEAADHLRRAEEARAEGRWTEARDDLLAAIRALRLEGGRVELAQALRAVGEVERRLEEAEDALRHYEESVAILRQLDEPLLLAHTVRHLGNLHYDAGRPALAERCYVEALALHRKREGARRSIDFANTIRSLAVLKQDAGDLEGATGLWERAIDIYEAMDVPTGVAESAARLALLARRGGDLQGSRDWLSKADAAADASGDPGSVEYVREVRASIEG